MSLLDWLSVMLLDLLWNWCASKRCIHVVLSVLRCWHYTWLRMLLHVRVLSLTHEVAWPLLLHVLCAHALESLLLLLWKCTYIAKVSPTVDSLRLVSSLRRHHIIIHSIFLFLVFGLENWLVRILYVWHGLHRILTSKLPVEITHEVILLQLVWFEWKHRVVHVLVSTTTAIATLGFLHLWHFLLWLGLGNDLIEVLVWVVENYDWRILLLALVHHLNLLSNNLVLFLLIEYLVLLAYFLNHVKIDQFLWTTHVVSTSSSLVQRGVFRLLVCFANILKAVNRLRRG